MKATSDYGGTVGQYRISRRLFKQLVFGATLWTIACTNATTPDRIDLRFRSNLSNAPVVTPSASGGVRSVRVVGGYAGPACGNPVGVAQKDGMMVRLEVGPVVKNPPCDTALVYYDYEATIDGLEPGRYTVEVYHRSDPTYSRQVVLTAEVAVN